MSVNDITRSIIGAAIAVHRQLGPGLLESAYDSCLVYELADRGLGFERQCPIRFEYHGRTIDCGYRLDYIVEHQVIIELKSVARLHPIHLAQMLTYLKLTGLGVGLLINFNVDVLLHGIRRVVPRTPARPPSPPQLCGE